MGVPLAQKGALFSMKRTELSLLDAYVYNNRTRLEDEVRELQTNLRFRKVGVSDCIELASALERLDMFKQVTKDIRILLKMCDK